MRRKFALRTPRRTASSVLHIQMNPILFYWRVFCVISIVRIEVALPMLCCTPLVGNLHSWMETLSMDSMFAIDGLPHSCGMFHWVPPPMTASSIDGVNQSWVRVIHQCATSLTVFTCSMGRGQKKLPRTTRNREYWSIWCCIYKGGANDFWTDLPLRRLWTAQAKHAAEFSRATSLELIRSGYCHLSLPTFYYYHLAINLLSLVNSVPSLTCRKGFIFHLKDSAPLPLRLSKRYFKFPPSTPSDPYFSHPFCQKLL